MCSKTLKLNCMTRFKNHPKNAKIIELKNKFIAKRNHDPIGL